MATRYRAGTRNGIAYYKAGKKPSSGGSSSGESSGSSSSSSNSRLARQRQQSQAIADWKAGKITQEEASSRVKRINRGGGSGAAADARKFQAFQQAQAKSIVAAQASAKANLERARVLKEQQRLATVKKNLLLANARKSKVVIRDNAGDVRLTRETLIKNGVKIVTETNLKTGLQTIKQFKAGRVVGGLSGGIPTTPIKDIIPSIKKTNDPNRLTVTMPGVKPFTIRATGTVIVGKEFAGKRLIFKEGILISIDGKGVSGISFTKPKPLTVTKGSSTKVRFIRGFQKVFVSSKFRSDDIKAETAGNIAEIIAGKMSRGEKLTPEDLRKVNALPTGFDNIIVNIADKDVATFAKITGGAVGTLVPGAQVPGAIVWAIGDLQSSVKKSAGDGKKITKKEFQKIVIDSATRGAIMGFGAKLLGTGGSLIGKRILARASLVRFENMAMRSALNHGGFIIKYVGLSGKNFITTYFLKDALGNVFDITRELKSGNINNAIKKAVETGGSVGGYIGGSAIGKATTKGGLFITGKLVATSPEFAQKKIPLDVMSKQLLSEGKIVLTRRGVYETGKGLSPRKDAWLDSRVKNPTKSIFWRFDKTLSKKDQAISPLPLFTKGKSGYFKMFKANWNRNKGMSAVKRYIKTTAETPLLDDVVIKRVVNLKGIKDVNLRKQITREFATKGKLSKATQDKVLKNNFPISDKNREFGFHDENEFVTRTGFKFKGRTDISFTYDPSLGEYVPVVQSLKDTSRIKNFLSILDRRNIITRTDAKFILDNYAIKSKFKSSSILPEKHSYQHMKNVENNIVKIIKKYPEFNGYWKKKYGSVAKATAAMKQAMWHDIGKGESSSQAFGTPHGEKVWRVWKAGLLPKDIKLKKAVAVAIRKHETLDPRRLWYKVQNRLKLVTPEQKIVATADRLDLNRVGIKIDLSRLPLRDVIKRLKINVKWTDYPSKFKSIINKIKIDKGVTKADLKKLSDYVKRAIVEKVKVVKRFVPKKTTEKTVRKSTKKKSVSKKRKIITKRKRVIGKPKKRVIGKPNRRTPVKTKRRPPKRPAKRTPKRPTGRTPKRIKRRPAKRPAKRPKKRQVRRPPKRPTKRPSKKPRIVPRTLPKGFSKRTLKKKQPTFYIKIKRRGRIVNLTPRPLVLRDAKDFLAYSVDNGLEKSAWFEPLGKTKKAVKLPSKMKGYFGRNSRKLRPFKIRVGKKRAIRNGYIEKRKYGLDTKREKSQMRSTRKQTKRRMIKRKPLIKRSKTNRPIKQRRTPVRRTPKRRTPPKRTRKKLKVVRRKPMKKKVKRSIKKKPVKRKPSKKKPSRRKRR
jgi:hypothetical protein